MGNLRQVETEEKWSVLLSEIFKGLGLSIEQFSDVVLRETKLFMIIGTKTMQGRPVTRGREKNKEREPE